MPVQFFELLAPVIDGEVAFVARRQNMSVEDVYELIVDEAERNQAEWYSNRVPNLNYKSPECRLAYLYIVAAANAGTFQHVLERNEDLRNYVLRTAQERHEIRVCAFGAGPGTELLALAKFFEQQKLGYSVSVDFQLLDRVEEWSSSWYGIRDQVNENFRTLYGSDRSKWPIIPAGNFIACDVTALDRLSYLGNIWRQDVYVVNFLLSEIFTDNPGLRAFLSQVASMAPTGARFVFIERRGSMWVQRMMNIAAEAGLVLSGFVQSQGSIAGDETPGVLGALYNAIHERRMPRLNWNVVYSVGIKQ
ncbi:MAG: hypothetical protein ABW250_22760 [Pyrinomonadaceae bacterium]